jgi:outer membrane protein TolC
MRKIVRSLAAVTIPLGVLGLAQLGPLKTGIVRAQTLGTATGSVSGPIGGVPSGALTTAPSVLASSSVALPLLEAKPNGLTSEQAVTRALSTSKQAKVDKAKIESAEAGANAAWDTYFPRVTLTARYTRLSSLDPIVLGGFVIPFILNNYVAQASVTVPFSDYVLKTYHAHESALANVEAQKWNAKVSQSEVANTARVFYYNWQRARGAVVVAGAAVQQNEVHLKDLKTQLLLKAATTADVYTVEARVAQAQLALIRSENLVLVTEANLRLLMHAPDEENLELGEDLMAELPSVAYDLKNLKVTALSKRPEIHALDAQIDSTVETRATIVATMFPRLDGFGDYYYMRPNSRIFPAVDEFRATWDVGIQLTWSPNDTLIGNDQKKQIDGNIAALKATREQLVDGIGLEVVNVFSSVREAEGSVAASTAGLRAAEEGYRVRLEQFHNGATTSALLIDSETDLTRARLEALNARVDLRIARANLRKAIGE